MKIFSFPLNGNLFYSKFHPASAKTYCFSFYLPQISQITQIS